MREKAREDSSVRKLRYVPGPWTFYFQQHIIIIKIARRHLIEAMISSTTKIRR